MRQKERLIFLLWLSCVSNQLWSNYDPDSANLTHIDLSFILGMTLSAVTGSLPRMDQCPTPEANWAAEINGASHRGNIDFEHM